MSKIFQRLTILCFVLLIGACETTDGAIRDQGHSEPYVQGFHDGRHSGMSEAGNTWEHYIRDHERFASDSEYKSGWLAGEAEGKHLQKQAQTIGEAAAGSYSSYKIGEEVDKSQPDAKKIANDVMKDVDTSDMKNLEK